MVKKSIQISWDEGIAMKSIALLIQKASAFNSTIHIAKGDRRANAKSLLGMMSLGIDDGTELDVTAEGSDADLAVKTLIEFLQNPIE